MRRYLKWISGVVATLVVAAAVAAYIVVWRQLPDRAAPAISGLSAAVTVTLDDRAVPTIRAETLLDAIRVQGYLVARERMFQLELMRRTAEGTLSEVFGAGTLGVDRLHRLYGFKQVAEQAVGYLPGDEREALEAFAAGVNAFIDSHPGRLGLEFVLLGLAPRRWSPADSLGVLLLMQEDLASSWRDELLAESMAGFPEPVQRFFMPRTTAADLPLIPDAGSGLAHDEDALFAAQPGPQAGLGAGRAIPADDLGLPARAGERGEGIGSNGWVVSGSRSKSGKPILANDLHLDLSCPPLFYTMRIELPNRWVQGITLVGLPGVVVGQNDRLAWGFANLGTDVQDLYREPMASERTETIAVQGAESEAMQVPLGAHGPQVRPGLSLRWAALDPHNVRLPLMAMMMASDWTSFNGALDGFYGPAQSVVYADVDGHIGWRAVGLVPLRGEHDDGSAPKEGADAGKEWRGFVPMREMPRVFDPPEGYLVAANQRVIGSSFPHVVATRWASANRARRIAARIEEIGSLDRGDVESINFDVVSPLHRDLMRALAAAHGGESLAAFASWDGAARADDARFLDAIAWLHGLRSAMRERLLGPSDESNGATSVPIAVRADEALIVALRADEAAWVRAGLGDKRSLLLDAEQRARAYRSAQAEDSWGEHNALHIAHPFGMGGGILGWIFNPPGFAQPGAESTVRATGRQYGQSMRLLVDWGAPDATTLVLPLGQSGHLGSSHRFDQQAAWRDGDPGGEHTRIVRPAQGEPLVFSP